ncbi:serine/threonine protein kinase [Parablautia sp. Marseille-Q6255]|uniref:serine/threonine protein kinase n=1 Tax=Parablautia sp. Marseille-Q6255 TaxID=3039593 RepID=UPI0024BC6290|nr:protein kinase [Parablautia sp. Marseille-Q6255]
MKRFPEHIPRILPPALSRTYTIRSCLKYTKQSATYLLSTRASAQEYLLKTAVPSVYSDMLANEKKILEHIHRSSDSVFACAFPLPVYLAVHRGITYYIRTYIPGQTLEDLCEINYTRPGIDPDLALEYVISLTRLLQFMHSMEPPLIHRDIKPQNVVIDPDGGCHFIDLGISQLYRTELSDDITIMGTKLTAPPEQFRCHHTDIRSDLYSLGILFYYCLTGEYKVTDAILDELGPHLAHIIQKVTRPCPKERYQSAAELLAALQSART